jgi:outer membrane protein assembly factor BamB
MKALHLKTRPSRRTVAISALLVAALLAGFGAAQEQLQRQNKQPNPAGAIRLASDGAWDKAGAVLIEPSAPIMNLFSRAEEGVSRRDWKFAIDSLQRVIDDPDGSLLPRLDRRSGEILTFESTRLRALRRLLELPAEALAAYRLIYDGKAKGLYERGLATGDAALLREIVDRYLLTRHGDAACDRLASWLLDGGHFGETIDLLQDCLSLLPEGEVPRELMVGKLTAALAASGRSSEARSVVAGFAGGGELAEARLPDWLVRLADGSLHVRAPSRGSRSDHESFQILAAPTQRAPMPAVDPTLIEPVPWQYELPWRVSELWSRVANDEPQDLVALPAIHAVTDGRRLFVRRPLGIAALDMDDLTLLWETVPWGSRSFTQLNRGRGATASSLRRFADREERWSLTTAYEDYLIGALSLAEQVLCTIEWRDPAPGQATPASNIQRFFRAGVTQTSAAPANRLIAFDPDTGAFLWDRGRTLDPADPLGQGEFRAVPIGVNGRLWVPYLENSDLYLAVLEPSDGSLHHRILLGSLGEFDRLHGQILPPAYADGLVFVPTARGVVFAVDANTHTLRWATQYEDYAEEFGRRLTWQEQQQRLQQRVQQRQAVRTPPEGSGEWLPSPPVVAHGLVLILPRQGGELFALSANRGEYRWAASVPSAAYIIAAEEDYVWLGGRGVTCLSLADGSVLWTTEVTGTPTGWGAVCGDRVLVPTVEGLHILDAKSGEVEEIRTVPSTQPPLGNLMCVPDSMVSVDPSSVRKFPDIARTFEAALAQHRAAPDDVRVALRLAWMYLFQDQPDTAFQTLDRLTPEVRRADPQHAAAVASLLVSALHDMADRAGEDKEASLKLLERALDFAASATDRLRTSLAIADRQRTIGAVESAYTTLWNLALSDIADQTITINDVVKTSARREISHRIRSLTSTLSDARFLDLTERGLTLVQEAVERVRSGHDARAGDSAAGLKTLRAVVETGFPPAAASSALFELADLEAEAKRFEQADLLLRQGAATSAKPEIRAAALIRLYALYREQPGVGDGPAEAVLERLVKEHRSLRIDRDMAAGFEFDGAPRVGDTIGEWALDIQASRRKSEDQTAWNPDRLPPSSGYVEFGMTWELLPRTYQNEKPTAPFELADDLQLSLESISATEPPRMIQLDATTRSLMGNRVLFHSGGDVVYCQEPESGELLWQSSLRSPGTFSEALDSNRGRAGDGSRRAVADGQVVVVNGNEGLFGIGLFTGRRLWVRPYEHSLRAGVEHLLDYRMAAQDGYLAAMPRDGYLTLMRMRDGSTVWERDLRGEQVRSIELTGDRVIAADLRLQRVMVYDRDDGGEIARLIYRQPDPETRGISLVATEGVLCGPDVDANSDAVVAHSLSDGQPLWRITTPKPLVQLFEPAPGYVGIGLLGGDIKIVEATTGDVILDQHLSGAHAVTDARIVDATLLIQATTMLSGQRQPALIALDLATGGEVWRRNNLAMQTWSNAPLQVYKGIAPAVVMYEQPAAGQLKDRTGVALFDVHTGEIRAIVRDVLPPRSRARINGEIGVWDRAIIVGTTLGIQAYEPRGTEKPPLPESH